MHTAQRILAIALKEWRLNTRFFIEYIAANLVSPIKSTILMYLLYAGLIGRSNYSFGILNSENFLQYVLIGTTCHSLFLTSVYIFRTKMVMEKWWQTVTATLISPASTLELVAGFILGSGSTNIFIALTFMTVIHFVFSSSLLIFIQAIGLLLLLSVFGFGIGLIGATLSLCFEGKSFIFDYGIQLLIFLSCFYYPIETLPKFLHGFTQVLPTYQTSQLIQNLYLVGNDPNSLGILLFLLISCGLVLILPALFFERSVKKYGIVGY